MYSARMYRPSFRDNQRFGLVFAKTGFMNSDTVGGGGGVAQDTEFASKVSDGIRSL